MRVHYGVVPLYSVSGSAHEMDRKEILEKLKTTEEEIRVRIEQAQHTRNDIITQAQRKARKLQEDHEYHIKTDGERLMMAAKKDIDVQQQRVIKEAIVEAESVKKKAQINNAKDFFIKRFKEYLHV
jgi:vacuolar-type H+-ATPase subunit H